ncbi:cardiolipin synthase [uncultured Rothia sp.]|uniref:cardiolipin synthase n=1 Tax=uncultured Rothia sp. TaxID=316088 RepID=UPI003216E9E8
MNFFNSALTIGDLPDWLSISLFILDFIVRIVAICWLPYNRKPVVALGWLMAIFLIPYVGFIAFLIFGSSNLPRQRRARQRVMNELMRDRIDKDDQDEAHPILGSHVELSEEAKVAARLNYRLGALPLVGGNEFLLHTDSHEAMLHMAREIDKAEKYVHFEFYITAYSGASVPLWDALFRAHDRGVNVKILIDQIGSRKYPNFKTLRRMLKEKNMNWHLMLPLNLFKREWQRPDLRNHRKVLVIDGRIAYSGSQNAIDACYDLKKNEKKGLLWKDLTYSCTGPIVDELNAVFISDWYSETNELVLSEINSDIQSVNDGQLAQIVPSGPGFETENNLRLINYLINNAEERIVICSPYFVPESTLLQALTSVAISGIDVELIVCEKGDQFLPNMAQRSYYEELLKCGVKIRQYPSPTVLHSKYMIIDDSYTFIGSSNMDPRSFALNMEVSTYIVDKAMVRELDVISDDYISKCKTLNYDEWVNRSSRIKVVENICRLWSSLL